jgi:hypothetical protein
VVHPILAVIALGGLVYSFSPMCWPEIRLPQRLCYGAMLFLSVSCPWPAWAIFLACFGGYILIRVLLRPRFHTPEEFCEQVRKSATRIDWTKNPYRGKPDSKGGGVELPPQR